MVPISEIFDCGIKFVTAVWFMVCLITNFSRQLHTTVVCRLITVTVFKAEMQLEVKFEMDQMI